MSQDMSSRGWKYSNKDGWHSRRHESRDRTKNWRDQSGRRHGNQRRDDYDERKGRAYDQKPKQVNTVEAKYEDEDEENFL